jgi:hypothetical protein
MPFPVAKCRLSWVAGITSLRHFLKSSDVTWPISFTVTTCDNGNLGQMDGGSGNVEVCGCRRARNDKYTEENIPNDDKQLGKDVADSGTDDVNLGGRA